MDAMVMAVINRANANHDPLLVGLFRFSTQGTDRGSANAADEEAPTSR